MFNKLLANLPFNPSLIDQVSFYAKRLHQETSVRRLSLIMVSLGMLVQMFAVWAPAEPTLALSNNDVIRGGFKSKDQAMSLCNTNNSGFATILNHFGVSCAALAAGQVKSIRSTDHNRQLYSMGRLPYGKPGETSVTIPSLGVFYMRPLWSWDSGAYSTYTAIAGTRSDGTPFMVLYNCGNIVIVGAPVPPPPPPPPTPAAPEPCPYNPALPKGSADCKPCDDSENQDDTAACLILRKNASNDTQNIPAANGTMAKAGDVITYTLSVENTGKATVLGFIVEENISDILEYAEAETIDFHGGSMNSENLVRWPAADIQPGVTLNQQLTVKVKDPIPQTPISSSDPGSYDLTMTNVYGNAVNIKLPPTVVKTTEQVTRTLPNTGPAANLTAGFTLLVFVGYFFLRSRLLAKELDLLKVEYTQS
jgi:uncharacterized repeat protein (TIGR01451 family)